MNTLEKLKQYTKIVADTGNLEEICQWKPEEATTNPSLLLKAFQTKQGVLVLKKARDLAQCYYKNPDVNQIQQACAIVVAQEILQQIPGRVSIEVSAHASFNTQQTIAFAEGLISLGRAYGTDVRRILVKIASTWEGIQAARYLESHEIACNCTLIFNEIQALACAQAKVTLISPFVGRIYDWYRAHQLFKEGEQDPGVLSVQRIFNLLKQQGSATEVMGASFRNVNEILALAGCDRLTVAPKFLKQLSEMEEEVVPQLKQPKPLSNKSSDITEEMFRWALNQDPMATEKLAEGIRSFAKDEELLRQMISSL